jgi:hypothetical protein
MSTDRLKLCWTCREDKPVSGFPNSYARRCTACVAEVKAAAVCEVCGTYAGLRHDGRRPRRVCTDPVCILEKRRINIALGHAANAQKTAGRTTKTCPACAVEKPLTGDHWSPRTKAPDGTVLTYDSYCRPCKAADQSARYHSDEERRRDALDRNKRARDLERERCAQDPVYAAAVAERKRAWERARRARNRNTNQEGRRAERARADTRAFPALPAKPLGDAVTAIAKNHPEGLAGFCIAYGVDERSVRAWRTGGDRHDVQFDVADKVLANIARLWWEVWTPGTPEGLIAEAAFEGSESVAA